MQVKVEEHKGLTVEDAVAKYRELFKREQDGEIRVIRLYPITEVSLNNGELLTYTVHVEYEQLKEKDNE